MSDVKFRPKAFGTFLSTAGTTLGKPASESGVERESVLLYLWRQANHRAPLLTVLHASDLQEGTFTQTLATLKKRGLIELLPGDIVSLTERGKTAADVLA